MQAIQEATASERLTLEEEYENQESWRESHDKLTFILCQPNSDPAAADFAYVRAGQLDTPERMIGDINFFLYPWDDDEDEASANSETNYCIGEVDIMIADLEHRSKGFGRASVSAFLFFIFQNLRSILQEYSLAESRPHTTGSSSKELKLMMLMVKIKADNAGSIALFRNLGFVQQGEVNYFGEIKMTLEDFNKISSPAPEGYKEIDYVRPIN